MTRWILVMVTLVFLWLASQPYVYSQPGMAAGDELRQIISNQEKILANLDAIKKELHIIKIRATR